jgi:hypothetical protein
MSVCVDITGRDICYHLQVGTEPVVLNAFLYAVCCWNSV